MKAYAYKLLRKTTKDIIMIINLEPSAMEVPSIGFEDSIIDNCGDFFNLKVDVEKAKQRFFCQVPDNKEILFLTSLTWSDIHIAYKNGENIYVILVLCISS